MACQSNAIGSLSVKAFHDPVSFRQTRLHYPGGHVVVEAPPQKKIGQLSYERLLRLSCQRTRLLRGGNASQAIGIRVAAESQVYVRAGHALLRQLALEEAIAARR